MSLNKRKTDRRHLIDHLDVYNQDDNSLFGYLIDVTIDGMKISTENTRCEGELFNLKLNIPVYFNTKTEILFEAQCMWSKKLENSSYNGLKFSEISEEDLEIIKTLFL